MKLYQVPRDTRIKLVETGEEVNFHHLDGLFSFCSFGYDPVSGMGKICHPCATTEVEIIGPCREVGYA